MLPDIVLSDQELFSFSGGCVKLNPLKLERLTSAEKQAKPQRSCRKLGRGNYLFVGRQRKAIGINPRRNKPLRDGISRRVVRSEEFNDLF